MTVYRIVYDEVACSFTGTGYSLAVRVEHLLTDGHTDRHVA